MVVCQPGTTAVAKFDETGITNNNKSKNEKNWDIWFNHKALTCFGTLEFELLWECLQQQDLKEGIHKKS